MFLQMTQIRVGVPHHFRYHVNPTPIQLSKAEKQINK